MRSSDLGRLLEQNKLCIPEEKCLPDCNIKVPRVFIADEAYPLRENLMKPYSKNLLGMQKKCIINGYQVLEKPLSVPLAFCLLSGYIETLPKTADDIIK